ncbi:MAG: autotransporter domain-containing protein, partial [Reyranella sp.]|nr:autotransporter domain-containing protein [Reyranella sp.]
GAFNVTGSTVTAGSGADGGGAGSAFGSGIFLQGSSGMLTFTPGSSQSQTVANVIADQTGSGGSGGNAGSYALVKNGAGTLTLSAANTYTGATTVNAGTLLVNGSVTSAVTVGTGGTLGGTGTIAGLTTINGTLAPGNSIGTLNVTGNFVQAAGSTYQVEVNAAGQSDRINVTGTATINGGTVQVIAQSGRYARNTTYTILNATGGRTGTYANVTSNFAFLTPSLSYDANNVFLSLALSGNAFSSGAQTPNQFAVGTVLDAANTNATGDFATVLNALAVLNTQQGPAALNAISGQPYANLGTANVAGSLLFLNALGTQMAGARGGGSAGATRVALAEACTATCDASEPAPWGAWLSGLGGMGNVQGNANAGGFNYNFGGTAAGADVRLGPQFLVGLALGFASGKQSVSGFSGSGWSDAYSAAVYASFTQGGFYADGLAGYAYADNRLQRQIVIPGLAPRTANGSTGANQFLGQLEAGYKVGVYEPAQASITPFARLQTVAVSQNGFTESGANSLNLNVAQQNTTSVRTVLGADLGAAIPLGEVRTLDVALRLGWAHEYADTTRPMTAAFAGAPALPFTVFGAQPPRDSAVVGFGLNTQVAERTSLYARYDGELANGNDAHAFSAGLRMTW